MKIDLFHVKRWDAMPDIWKYFTTPKKVSYLSSPKDDGLIKLIEPYLSEDDLRPAMTHIFFDNKNKAIVGTDAHRLIALPKQNDTFEGLYLPNSDSKYTENRFPDYTVVISDSKPAIVAKIDIEKLYCYVTAVQNGNYSNTATMQIRFLCGFGSIAFNSRFLLEALDTFIRLGYSEVYMCMYSARKGAIFLPTEKYTNKPIDALGKEPIVLLMPLMQQDDDTGIDGAPAAGDVDFEWQCHVFYRLETNEILNIDGSVAEYKKILQKPDNLGYLTNQQVSMLKRVAKPNKLLPILEGVYVDNKRRAVATDLETYLIIKNVDLDEGMYLIVNGALVDSPDDPYNFPELPDLLSIETSVEFDEFVAPLVQAADFISDDDLRPALTGVNLIFDSAEKRLTTFATNAYIAYEVNQGAAKLSALGDFEAIVPNPKLTGELIKGLSHCNFGFAKGVEKNGFKKEAVWKQVAFFDEDTYIIQRVIDHKSPYNKNIFPSEYTYRVELDSKAFDAALKSASKYKKELIGIVGEKVFSKQTQQASIGVYEAGNTRERPQLNDLGTIEVSAQKEKGKVPDCKIGIMPVTVPEGDERFIFRDGATANDTGDRNTLMASYKNWVLAKKYFPKSKTFDILISKPEKMGIILCVPLPTPEPIARGAEPVAPKASKPAKEPKKSAPAKAANPSKNAKTADEEYKEKVKLAIQKLDVLAKKGNKTAVEALKALKLSLKLL